ncbi:MAG: hypothetical protein AAF602_17190, partial [Myxococcota bacterium]
MLAVVLALGAPSAVAADVDLFVPAASLSRLHGTLQAEAPAVRAGGLAFGVTGAWIADPVLQGPSSAVRSLVPLHLQGSFASSERIRFDAALPVYANADVPLSGHSGAAMGDVRVGALVGLAGRDDGPVALGVLPTLTLPTGSSDALVSRGWSGAVTAALGGRLGPVGWVVNGSVGLAGNAPLDAPAQGVGLSGSTVGGAFVQIARPVRVGAEVDAHFGGVSGNARDQSRSASLQGFAQIASGQGLGLLLGGGTGLVSGVGTARYRFFGGLSWSAWRSDVDQDSIADRVDGCPDVAEDVDGFEDADGCPEPDNDGDGIADVDDDCTDEAEDVDDWLDDDGCPEPDNDEDGLVDAVDECPTVSGLEMHGGCPDRDGDGLRDLDDTCPDGAGPASDAGCPDSDGDRLHDGVDACPEQALADGELRRTADGCPRPVYVTATAIVTPRISFDEGGASLGESPRQVLDDVAAKLLANPDLGRVE